METEFLLTSLAVVLIPGTGVIYTVSTGLFNGWRASIAAAIGCTFGILPHLLACILGLAAVLHLGALAFQTLKLCGAAYLLYLAWCMWREKGSLAFNASTSRRTYGKIALRGFLINILNPKLSIFFLAFLPQFIPAKTASPLMQLFTLSATFMLMTLVVFILYGACAHGVRNLFGQASCATAWMQRGCAALFAALGIRLALADK